MAGVVVQSKTKAQNTTTASGSITFDSPAAAGNTIVVIYGGDDYVTSGNKPSGFTEPTGARQETFLGHYVWYKVAAGGETTVSFTLSGPATHAIIALELSGVGALNTSNGTLSQSAGTTMTTPAVTPTAGARFAVATIGGSLNAAFNTGMGSWTNSYAEQADVATTLGSGTRDNIAVATLSFTADGTSSTSTGVTWDNAVTPQARTGIILVFAETAAGTNAAATEATATGTAPGPVPAAAAGPTESAATGTAADPTASAGATAPEATATGAANGGVPGVAANPDAAAAAGTADNPGVSAPGSASPPEASGAGSAPAPVPAVAANALEATGTGTAEWDAGSAISLDLVQDNPVDGVGVAYNATVSTSSSANPSAPEAAGVGTADNPAAAVTVLPAAAAATGAAQSPAVSTVAQASPDAGVASAAAAALDPVAAVQVLTAAAVAVAQALDATGLAGAPGSATAGAATGSGAAFGARTRKSIPRPFTGVTQRPYAGVTLRP